MSCCTKNNFYNCVLCANTYCKNGLEKRRKEWYTIPYSVNQSDVPVGRGKELIMAENNGCTHDCSTCGADCSSRKPESLLVPQNAGSDVKKVIGIVSGKGFERSGRVGQAVPLQFCRYAHRKRCGGRAGAD